MLDMLKQTGRPEMVVGWYHSHPGFGCWLSGTDMNTQQSFEALNPRAVALVVDPIQSVKGKVVIDCFRLIDPKLLMMGQEARQTTSNIGFLNKPSIQALIHGLNRHYYSIVIDYRKNELEEQMLMNLHKHKWTGGLTVEKFEGDRAKRASAIFIFILIERTHSILLLARFVRADLQSENERVVEKMLKLSRDYDEKVKTEEGKSANELIVEAAGKVDPKRHLENHISDLMSKNIIQTLSTMLDTVVF